MFRAQRDSTRHSEVVDFLTLCRIERGPIVIVRFEPGPLPRPSHEVIRGFVSSGLSQALPAWSSRCEAGCCRGRSLNLAELLRQPRSAM